MNLSDAPEYLTVKQLAAVLQVPVATIYQWRHRGEGPQGMRVGGHVRFHRNDVLSWLDTCREPTARAWMAS
jgi:excisionase family DNA binding protein